MPDNFKHLLLPIRLSAPDKLIFFPVFFPPSSKMTGLFPVTLFTSSEVIYTTVMPDGSRHLALVCARACVCTHRKVMATHSSITMRTMFCS